MQDRRFIAPSLPFLRRELEALVQRFGIFPSGEANSQPAPSPVPIEEIERRRKERSGKPLAQIWDELAQKGSDVEKA
jgi:hypothetical protein